MRGETGLDGDPRDVPTWMNVLITDDMPIRWAPNPASPIRATNWPGGW